MIWLAITLSLLVFGALLLLIAPRAPTRSRPARGSDWADDRDRHRGRDRAHRSLAFVAAITLVGLPLAIGIGLLLAPLGTVAYLVLRLRAGTADGRGRPGTRMLAFLAGSAPSASPPTSPILSTIVGIAALLFGLGLLGAAIGAARDPDPDRLEPRAAEHRESAGSAGRWARPGSARRARRPSRGCWGRAAGGGSCRKGPPAA